jgi:hypothetical protein
LARRKKKTKTKGHPGFSKKCRPLMSFKEWERRVKAVKRSSPNANPYAIVNSACKNGKKVSRRRRRSRKRKKR